jgi:L,D-peptidoglycan transpeptidase YkuD (ErfK/YbiS/YcfS/YnhG family)
MKTKKISTSVRLSAILLAASMGLMLSACAGSSSTSSAAGSQASSAAESQTSSAAGSQTSSAAESQMSSASASSADSQTASSSDSSSSTSYSGAPKANSVWMDSRTKYRSDDQVNHLIFVQCQKNSSDAHVQIYEKDKTQNNAWTITLECEAYIGRKGYAVDKKEGDSAVPVGDFGVTTAFGIKANPGTQLDWLDVTDDLWCPDADVADYNKIVSSKNGGTAEGEHLIEYSPEYNYAMFLDYNKEGVYGKGSAIFFHCMGPKQYTGGCVAVKEENMKYILSVFGKNDRVIIAPYEAE